MLKALWTKHLQLKCDILLSSFLQVCFNFAFNFNLRHYSKVQMLGFLLFEAGAYTRPLLGSDLSRLRH